MRRRAGPIDLVQFRAHCANAFKRARSSSRKSGGKTAAEPRRRLPAATRIGVWNGGRQRHGVGMVPATFAGATAEESRVRPDLSGARKNACRPRQVIWMRLLPKHPVTACIMRALLRSPLGVRYDPARPEHPVSV